MMSFQIDLLSLDKVGLWGIGFSLPIGHALMCMVTENDKLRYPQDTAEFRSF